MPCNMVIFVSTIYLLVIDREMYEIPFVCHATCAYDYLQCYVINVKCLLYTFLQFHGVSIKDVCSC